MWACRLGDLVSHVPCVLSIPTHLIFSIQNQNEYKSIGQIGHLGQLT